MARRLGITRIEVRVDSSLAILLLEDTFDSSGHVLAHVLLECKQLLQGFSLSSIRHLWREGNQCADHLASLAHSSSPGVTILDTPPLSLSPLLLKDSLGVDSLRL
ncbi:putative ribonuclease H protein [Corchorus olitorius]|uniref:Ribonuclease H protein n=1 Tax=Corchorus olitorius TaxID=93759 RepID=A0A1R3L3Z0_9ROSI|nr:putative ribonuclease H protein [Corchorus olitorius]